VVNFWLPIPTGALSYVSLKVKPVSGKTNLRSAFSSLFAAGKPDDDASVPPNSAPVDGVPVDGAPADSAPADSAREEEGEGGQVRTA
jgi:hypothetical protein